MGVEPSDCNKLYIRLPVKIKDEFQIKDLHQNITEVHLPRQKSRRWCIIDFENKEKLQEAKVALKKVRIDNKSLKISPYKKGGDKNTQNTNRTSTKPLIELLKKITFIGNPFDQETEYDEDWEMNTVDEWIMPPQEVALVDDRELFLIDVAWSAEDDSDGDDVSDEDFNPEDTYDFDNSEYGYVDDSNDDEEDIDYVTYPIREEGTSEPDKPSTANTSNSGENSDTD